MTTQQPTSSDNVTQAKGAATMAATIYNNQSTVVPKAGAPNTEAEKAVEVITLPARFDAFADIDFGSCGHSSLVIDGRFVKFADLHALQSLVDARLAALSHGSDLLITEPSAEFRATLDLTGFGDLLNVVAPAPQTSGMPVRMALSGDVGPQEGAVLRQELAGMLANLRPRLEIDLVDVTSLHLGVVNVIMAAQAQARSNLGDLTIIVRQGSVAQKLFSRVGIAPVMRP